MLALFLFWHISLRWSFYALAIPGILFMIALLFLPAAPVLDERVQSLSEPKGVVVDKTVRSFGTYNLNVP